MIVYEQQERVEQVRARIMGYRIPDPGCVSIGWVALPYEKVSISPPNDAPTPVRVVEVLCGAPDAAAEMELRDAVNGRVRKCTVHTQRGELFVFDGQVVDMTVSLDGTGERVCVSLRLHAMRFSREIEGEWQRERLLAPSP